MIFIGLGIAVCVVAISYYNSLKPDFSAHEIEQIKAEWQSSGLLEQLRRGDHTSVDDFLAGSVAHVGKYLSPDYLPVLLNRHIRSNSASEFLAGEALQGRTEMSQRPREMYMSERRARRRLVMAHLNLETVARARIYATAFLIAPAETMVAGIALINEVCREREISPPSSRPSVFDPPQPTAPYDRASAHVLACGPCDEWSVWGRPEGYLFLTRFCSVSRPFHIRFVSVSCPFRAAHTPTHRPLIPLISTHLRANSVPGPQHFWSTAGQEVHEVPPVTPCYTPEQAKKYTRSQQKVDGLMARRLGLLAHSQQLVVGGCVRALRTEDAVNALFNSFNGRRALSRAVKYECHEILAVPQARALPPATAPRRNRPTRADWPDQKRLQIHRLPRASTEPAPR